MTSIATVLKSSVCQTARTPPHFLARLTAMHFEGRRPFDPCPPDYQVDGLLSEWEAESFVNPPFNALPAWIDKCVEQASQGKHVVLLMPARVSTKYFHKTLLPAARSLTVWCRPVTFPPFKSPFSLPIITVEFGGSRLHASNLKAVKIGELWRPDLTVDSARAWCAETYPACEMLPLFGDIAARCRLAREDNLARVLLMPPWFSSTYFRALLPMVTEVVLIGPRPRWQESGSTSLLGSVLVKLDSATCVQDYDGFTSSRQAYPMTTGETPMSA